jgi:Flp pilus assembly protein TadG
LRRWPGLAGTAHDLAHDTRAGVAILLAVSALALAAATGAALDFARALNFKLALQGAVDASALAGATEYLNTGSSSSASTVATNYITNSETSLPTNNGVTPTITTSISGTTYTVVVSATGSINASFLGVIEQTIPVTVSSTASSNGAPNINFYLLLDDSPSMGIAATTAGIATMVANTQGQCDSDPYGGSNCGCAFACHEANPSGESYYIPTGTYGPSASPTPVTGYPAASVCSASNNYQYCNFSGTGNPQSGQGGTTPPANYDNYTLAQNLGVTLRIDNLRTGVQNLMTTAASDSAANNAAYEMAIYTFDVGPNLNTIQTLTSSLSLAETEAGNIQQLEVYQNNEICSSSSCTAGVSNNDTDTDYTDSMNSINTIMPAPGNGTNARGDTPQEVLFFVTDGVEDQSVSGTRTISLMNTSYCTTIKNRGIRIAVLYTEYLPIPANGFYAANVSPFQSQISANMEACASPNLFYQVSAGGDISAALQALFEAVIQTAHLTQ